MKLCQLYPLVVAGILGVFALTVSLLQGGLPPECRAECQRDCPDARCVQPPCCNGDVNGDGGIDLADAVYILQYLFAQGPDIEPIQCSGCPPQATGLTTCYDDWGNAIHCASTDFPGQDAFYQSGCSMANRFIDNGDGTVTDNLTGLMWQQETADLNHDGIITSGDIDEPGPDQTTWQEALQYCDDLLLGTHTDWRLPNIRELHTIIDYSRRNPSIHPVFRCVSYIYWSSTSGVSGPGDEGGAARAAYFNSGRVWPNYMVRPLFVRAVRDGGR